MLKLLTIALNRLTLFYLGFLLLWLVFRFLWFDRIWWLALLNTFALWLLLPLVFVVPWVLGQRQWLGLGGLALPLVLALHWYGPLFLPSPWLDAGPRAIAQTSTQTSTKTSTQTSTQNAATVDRPTIKTMSFNLLWSNEDYDAIARAIRQDNPDIIGFQELRTGHTLPELVKRLGDRYPYSIVSPEPDFHSVGALSRFPIQQVDVFPEPPTRWGLKLQLSIQNQPLVLLVTHLEPTSLQAYGVGQWPAIARYSFAQRQAQVQQIRSVVAEADLAGLPVVMLCDCNMSETSAAYAALSRGLQDSFRQAGWGLGRTRFWGRFPVLRIDYIWHSRGIRAIAAHVGTDGASDHRPVVATLRL